MIFLIIGFFIILYALNNYHKAFCLFLIYKAVLVTNITVVSIPGIPMLTLDLFMTMYFTLLFFYKKESIYAESSPFPYSKPFKILAVSWLVSSIFAYAGFINVVSQYIRELFTNLIIVWLIWKNIRTKSDIIYLLKGFSIVFLLASVYGLYEHTFLVNPIADYEETLVSDQSKAINFYYDSEIGRGYRIKSFFEHPIGAGANWALFVVFFYSMILSFKIKLSRIYLYIGIITTLISIVCLFYTNSRSPILFLCISILSFLKLKDKKTYGIIIILLITILICLPFFSQYTILFLSLFDSNAQEELGGSDLLMRLDQFAAAIELMSQSPIWGLGYKFNEVISGNLVTRLWGLESIWLIALTCFGILGVYAYSLLAYYSLVKIPKKIRSREIFFLSLAYWVLITVTTIPGMLVYFYYTILIIYIKLRANKIIPVR